MGDDTKTTALPPDDRSLNIKQFCEKEGISEPTYFKMRDAGLGPTEMTYHQAGINAIRITYADRLAWQAMLKNPTAEQAEKMRRLRERLHAHTRAAATKATASKLHVSKPDSPYRVRRRKEREQKQGEAAR
jgi:hypothetical protein